MGRSRVGMEEVEELQMKDDIKDKKDIKDMIDMKAVEELRVEHEKIYWYWVSKFEEIGSKTIEKLLNDFRSMEAVFFSTEEELSKLEYITEVTRAKLLRDKSIEKLQEELNRLKLR